MSIHSFVSITPARPSTDDRGTDTAVQLERYGTEVIAFMVSMVSPVVQHPSTQTPATPSGACSPCP